MADYNPIDGTSPLSNAWEKETKMPHAPDRPTFSSLLRRVTNLLFDGTIRPGDRLGAKALADQLGVSPTPLREIVSRLVGLGLVEERRSEGYYVVTLDASTIVELYDMHGLFVDMALCTLICRPSLGDVTDPWIAFGLLADASANGTLRDVRGLIAFRLGLLRWCETQIVDDKDRVVEMISLFACGKLDACRQATRGFHRHRIERAQLLAFELAQGRPQK